MNNVIELKKALTPHERFLELDDDLGIVNMELNKDKGVTVLYIEVVTGELYYAFTPDTEYERYQSVDGFFKYEDMIKDGFEWEMFMKAGKSSPELYDEMVERGVIIYDGEEEND